MNRRGFFAALTAAFAWCTRWTKDVAGAGTVPSTGALSCGKQMATIKFHSGSREVTLPWVYVDSVLGEEWSLPLPTHHCWNRILSPARLPFRHFGLWGSSVGGHPQSSTIRFAIKLSPVYDTDRSAALGCGIDQSDKEMDVYHQLDSDKWIHSSEEMILLVHKLRVNGPYDLDGNRVIVKRYRLTNCLIAFGYLWFANIKADAPYWHVI